MKLFKYFLILIFVFSFYLFVPKQTNAAICTGQQQCCEEGVRDQCNGGPNDGGDCSDTFDCFGSPCELGLYCVGGAADGGPRVQNCVDIGGGDCRPPIGTGCAPGETVVSDTCAWGCQDDGNCDPVESSLGYCSDCAAPPACNNDGTCDPGESSSCPDCDTSPPAGWGACGSCAMPGCQASLSRTDPNGICQCDPTGCGAGSGNPGCRIDLNGFPREIAVDETVATTWNFTGYDIDCTAGNFATLSSSDSTIVTGSISGNNNSCYWNNPRSGSMRGRSVGTAYLNIRGFVDGPYGSAICTRSKRINVTPPLPWWQVRGGGNVMVGNPSNPTARVGNKIPSTCGTTYPSCDPNFITDDPNSGTPGVVVAPGNSRFKTSGTTGANSREWKAGTSYSGEVVGTDFYFNLSASKTVGDPGPVINGGDIDPTNPANQNWIDENDVMWLKHQGDVNAKFLNYNGSKTVILVECGDLLIGNTAIPGNGRIHTNQPNSSFMMIVVGKCNDNTKGNVKIRHDVDEVDAVIVADGDVTVESEADCTALPNPIDDDNGLFFRGSLVAGGDIILNRDFCGKENPGDKGNEEEPTETFENMPEWDLFYPNSLTEKHLYWREIVP